MCFNEPGSRFQIDFQYRDPEGVVKRGQSCTRGLNDKDEKAEKQTHEKFHQALIDQEFRPGGRSGQRTRLFLNIADNTIQENFNDMQKFHRPERSALRALE